MEQVYMYATEVNASCGKIRTFLVQEDKTVISMRQVLQALEECYYTNHQGKFITCHNQIIESTRNYYQNHVEYNNFTEHMKNTYEEVRRQNLAYIEGKQGEIK